MIEPTNTPPIPYDWLLHDIRQIVGEELATAYPNGSNMSADAHENFSIDAAAERKFCRMPVKPRGARRS